VNELIPGDSSEGKLNFIGQSFESVKGWMGNLITQNSLTQEGIVDRLVQVAGVSKDKLDYLGAFLDIAVKYYSHTGTQTLARRLIERAVAEI
jgi:hypothetical protein